MSLFGCQRPLNILLHNNQRGSFDVKQILATLQKEKIDYAFLQRFPHKWINHLELKAGKEGFRIHFTESFPDADNGCLTLFKNGSIIGSGFLSQTEYEDQDQGSCYIDLESEGIIFRNFLPPFPDGKITQKDYLQIIERGTENLPKNSILLGDTHYDTVRGAIKENNWHDLLDLPSFQDKEGRYLRLQKALSREDFQIVKSSTLGQFKENRHLPIIFSLKF